MPLFIFISGMNAYASCAKAQTLDFRKTLKRVGRIIVPYMVSVLLYLIAAEGFVDVRTYLNYVIHFNITPPHYFVLFFSQLLLVAPIMVRLIQKAKALPRGREVMAQILIIAGGILLAYFTMNYTYVLKVYGGGKYLLGGTFLVIFLWGMQAAGYDLFRFRWLRSVITFLVSAVLWVIWWRVLCSHQAEIDALIPFGPGDPPSISLTVLAFLMLIVVYSGTAFLQKISWLSFLPKAFAWIGRHSLYIFLYHFLIINYCIKPYFKMENPYLQLVVYLAGAILGPVGIECIFKTIKGWITKDTTDPAINAA